ncbi:MAG: hypothetical protein KatS3mg102_2542 [Planctomycetota bacterium]|nr:MAG: hypothetical protein KatS3mg102_2542 [Planctomycetota bacterium]
MRCASLQRNAEGLWVPSLLAPRLEPAPGTAGPPPLVLLGGRPDWQGGWVFAAPDGLWRMGADGAARPLVRLPLPQQGVRLSRPLVMPNGDVWIALNRELESGAHFTRNSPHRSPEVAGMWFAAGEPSRWVRVRLEGGQAQLAGIRGQRLLEALRGAGAPLEGGVVQTTQLRYEPASGGIAAFDAHHHLFFVLAPAD